MLSFCKLFDVCQINLIFLPIRNPGFCEQIVPFYFKQLSFVLKCTYFNRVAPFVRFLQHQFLKHPLRKHFYQLVSLFLTAEEVLVSAFTSPPLSNSVKNFSKSVLLLLEHFWFRSKIVLNLF
jgi:hypothetical protein